MFPVENVIDRLKREILDMGAMVEDALTKATTALLQRRVSLADEVVKRDPLIDAKEVTIQVECVNVLALHHPVASQLRFIVAVLKLNNDLERVGDLAVNIAERARYLGENPAIEIPAKFARMIECTRVMLRNCLDALVNRDTELARGVRADDDEVDDINREMFQDMVELMRRDPDTIERALTLLSCSRYLERIADLATNVSEEVVYLVEGDVIRHGGP